MTDILRRFCITILLLVLLPYVSLGQRPSNPGPTPTTDAQVNPDLLLLLPSSDALITIDLKRLINDGFPRLLADEPTLQPLVLSLLDLKTRLTLDPQAVEHMVIGLRFYDPQPGMIHPDFGVVAIARSSEAARLPAIIGSAEYLEQQYEGKKLFISKTAKAEPQTDSQYKPNEFAITALNENIVVFGDHAYVRACIDVNAAKVKGISLEQVAALKRSPKALLSASSLLPSSLISAAQKSGSPQLSEALSSVKWLYASVELSPGGFEIALTTTTGSPEQAKSLADVLTAFKTIFHSFSGGKTNESKVFSELMRGLLISTDGNELQVRDVVTQATLNMLAKSLASEYYIDRGITQMRLSDPDGAIAQYTKSLLLDPGNAMALNNRGKANADKGNLDAAIADYDKAIALAPERGLIYNNRGFVRLRKKEFDAAILDFDKSIALDPTFAFPYNNRGQAFAEKGNLEKAMADYDKSIALDDTNAFAFANRGNARTQIGDLDGAIADLDRAITLSPKMAEAYNGRGNARYARYLQTGLDPELNQAIDDYNQAISLVPNDALLYANRGYALKDKEEYKRAIADFDKSLALNPKLAAAYNGRAIVRYFEEEFDQAIADFDRAIALAPNDADFYGNRALSRLALHLDEQAAQDLKKCYELDESNRAVYEPLVKDIKKTRGAKPRRR